MANATLCAGDIVDRSYPAGPAVRCRVVAIQADGTVLLENLATGLPEAEVMLAGGSLILIRRAAEAPRAIKRPPATAEVICPDCGRVKVRVLGWDNGRPVVGECLECRDVLYFA